MDLLTDQEYRNLLDKIEDADWGFDRLTPEEKRKMQEYEENLWRERRKEEMRNIHFSKLHSIDPRIPR